MSQNNNTAPIQLSWHATEHLITTRVDPKNKSNILVEYPPGHNIARRFVKFTCVVLESTPTRLVLFDGTTTRPLTFEPPVNKTDQSTALFSPGSFVNVLAHLFPRKMNQQGPTMWMGRELTQIGRFDVRLTGARLCAISNTSQQSNALDISPKSQEFIAKTCSNETWRTLFFAHMKYAMNFYATPHDGSIVQQLQQPRGSLSLAGSDVHLRNPFYVLNLPPSILGEQIRAHFQTRRQMALPPPPPPPPLASTSPIPPPPTTTSGRDEPHPDEVLLFGSVPLANRFNAMVLQVADIITCPYCDARKGCQLAYLQEDPIPNPDDTEVEDVLSAAATTTATAAELSTTTPVSPSAAAATTTTPSPPPPLSSSLVNPLSSTPSGSSLPLKNAMRIHLNRDTPYLPIPTKGEWVYVVGYMGVEQFPTWIDENGEVKPHCGDFNVTMLAQLNDSETMERRAKQFSAMRKYGYGPNGLPLPAISPSTAPQQDDEWGSVPEQLLTLQDNNTHTSSNNNNNNNTNKQTYDEPHHISKHQQSQHHTPQHPHNSNNHHHNNHHHNNHHIPQHHHNQHQQPHTPQQSRYDYPVQPYPPHSQSYHLGGRSHHHHHNNNHRMHDRYNNGNTPMRSNSGNNNHNNNHHSYDDDNNNNHHHHHHHNNNYNKPPRQMGKYNSKKPTILTHHGTTTSNLSHSSSHRHNHHHHNNNNHHNHHHHPSSSQQPSTPGSQLQNTSSIVADVWPTSEQSNNGYAESTASNNNNNNNENKNTTATTTTTDKNNTNDVTTPISTLANTKDLLTTSIITSDPSSTASPNNIHDPLKTSHELLSSEDATATTTTPQQHPSVSLQFPYPLPDTTNNNQLYPNVVLPHNPSNPADMSFGVGLLSPQTGVGVGQSCHLMGNLIPTHPHHHHHHMHHMTPHVIRNPVYHPHAVIPILMHEVRTILNGGAFSVDTGKNVIFSMPQQHNGLSTNHIVTDRILQSVGVISSIKMCTAQCQQFGGCCIVGVLRSDGNLSTSPQGSVEIHFPQHSIPANCPLACGQTISVFIQAAVHPKEDTQTLFTARFLTVLDKMYNSLSLQQHGDYVLATRQP